MSALMTTEEAAEYLAISPWALRHDARDGTLKIPVVRIGRRVRYRVRDLDRWIEKQTEVPGVQRTRRR